MKYKSGLDALNDLLAHNIDFQFTDPVTIKERVADGRLKALMLTSAEPFAALPNIPSARQAGVNNIDMISWWSVHVPAGTPKPVVDKLTGWFNEIARKRRRQKFLANLGSDPLIGNAALVDSMIAKETKEWEEYVKIARRSNRSKRKSILRPDILRLHSWPFKAHLEACSALSMMRSAYFCPPRSQTECLPNRR